METENYKRPILSVFFEVIGSLCLIVGILLLVVVVGMFMSDSDDVGELLSAIPAGLLLLLSGLLYFGLAQTINFLGRTAFNTSEIKKFNSSVPARLRTVQSSIKGLENIQRRILKHLVSDQGESPIYYIDRGESQSDDSEPITATYLKELYLAGSITKETAVFREGDSEWRKYGDYM